MLIKAEMDTSKLVASMLAQEKQLAYDVAHALNNTAKATQQRIRDQMATAFWLRASTKRDRSWLQERIKINFASVKKGVMYAEIYIDQKPARLLLGVYEQGGMRQPFVGKTIGVPNPLTTREGGTFAGELFNYFTFRELKLKKVNVNPLTTGYRSQLKGQRRTFLLKATAKFPLGGIFQRVGPGRDDIRLLYSFRKPFMLKRLLKMYDTANATMGEKFKVEFAIERAKSQPR